MRSRLRQRRQSLSADQQSTAARAVAARVLSLPQWRSAQKIALYAASDGEIDPTAIAEHCFAKGMQVFLPVVADDKQMTFAQWQRDDALVHNRYGIAEPSAQSPQQPLSQMDIICVPLVAWDRNGNRLGMGGGYYDRALAAVSKASTIGLAHGVQEVAALPQQAWDIALDMIITDREIHYCH